MTSSGYSAGANWVRVKACNSSGCSSYSPQTNFTVNSPPPPPPQNLRITPAGTQRHGDVATIQWDPVSGATSYLFFSSWPVCVSGCQLAGTQVGPGVNTSVGSGTHSFWVKACNATGCGGSTIPVYFAVQSNNAAFVSQKINNQSNPISFNVPPGQTTFSVELTFQNTGDATWDNPGGYVLRSKNPDGNTTWGSSEVQLVPSAADRTTVLKNQQVKFSGPVPAPTNPGTYQFQWQMYRKTTTAGFPDYGYFGTASTNVTITVPGPVSAQPIRVQLQIRAKQHLPIQ